MALVVYSQSRTFDAHVQSVLGTALTLRKQLSPPVAGAENIYLLHAASFERELDAWLQQAVARGVVIGIADDQPEVSRMLSFTEAGVRAYFNSYMAAPNYDQLVRLLGNGQSWFPPSLLNDVFQLARSVVQRQPHTDLLDTLTQREREVALAVAEGMSNKGVADSCNMSERTVKTHLTQIFKKLQVKDRVALVMALNGYRDAGNSGSSNA
jgi:DNA-binding NarL/FixJ family response regulator